MVSSPRSVENVDSVRIIFGPSRDLLGVWCFPAGTARSASLCIQRVRVDWLWSPSSAQRARPRARWILGAKRRDHPRHAIQKPGRFWQKGTRAGSSSARDEIRKAEEMFEKEKKRERKQTPTKPLHAWPLCPRESQHTKKKDCFKFWAASLLQSALHLRPRITPKIVRVVVPPDTHTLPLSLS